MQLHQLPCLVDDKANGKHWRGNVNKPPTDEADKSATCKGSSSVIPVCAFASGLHVHGGKSTKDGACNGQVIGGAFVPFVLGSFLPRAVWNRLGAKLHNITVQEWKMSEGLGCALPSVWKIANYSSWCQSRDRVQAVSCHSQSTSNKLGHLLKLKFFVFYFVLTRG